MILDIPNNFATALISLAWVTSINAFLLNISLALPAATSCFWVISKSVSDLTTSFVTSLPYKLAIPFKAWASGDLALKSSAFLPSTIPKAFKKSDLVMPLFFLNGASPAPLPTLACLV